MPVKYPANEILKKEEIQGLNPPQTTDYQGVENFSPFTIHHSLPYSAQLIT